MSPERLQREIPPDLEFRGTCAAVRVGFAPLPWQGTCSTVRVVGLPVNCVCEGLCWGKRAPKTQDGDIWAGTSSFSVETAPSPASLHKTSQ